MRHSPAAERHLQEGRRDQRLQRRIRLHFTDLLAIRIQVIGMRDQNQHATTSAESCLASTFDFTGGIQRLTVSFIQSSTGNA